MAIILLATGRSSMSDTDQIREHNRDGDEPSVPADRAEQSPDGDGGVWNTLAGQMAGRFPPAMSQLLRGHGQLRGVCVRKMQADEFRRVMAELACGHSYSRTGLSGGGKPRIWLGLDADAAGAMIDLILGGRPYQGPSAHRALTQIDRHLLGRVLNCAAGLFANVAGLPQPLLRNETAPMPECPAIAAVRFDLDIGGAMWLFANVEPRAAAPSGADTDEAHTRGGPIELSATLDAAEITAEQLAELDVGDIIATDVPVDGRIVVRLAGIPKYVGQLSTVDGRKAITITDKITEIKDDTSHR